jgi:hypothetical protein
MFGKETLEGVVRRHPDSFPAVKFLDNFHHFEGLYCALEGKWQDGWGSYLFNGKTYTYQEETLRKQEELYRYSMNAKNALEIGVYVGHSLLIMLLANPTLTITCIDNDDKFAKKAVDYLNIHFNNRITFIHDDAVKAIQKLEADSFDFIHIDADHNDEAVLEQFKESSRVAQIDATVVFDDYDAVKKTIDHLISAGLLLHVKTPECLWRNCITKLISKP